MTIEPVGWDPCCDCAAVAAAVVAWPGPGDSVTVLWTPEGAREDAAAVESGMAESGALEGALLLGGEGEALVLLLETSGNVVWEGAADERRIVMRVEEDVLEPSGKVSLLLLV